uniref:Putative mariner-1 aae n=1 Tax=Culex tarsalis TaxID=7177 RepID=A0A1Q3FFX7_CULTA
MFAGSDYFRHLSGSASVEDSKDITIANEPFVENEETSNGARQTKKRKMAKEKYTEVQLQLAIEAVQTGSTLYSACKMYGVPQGTLKYRLQHNIAGMEVRTGPKCYLSKAQETFLIGSLHSLADAGFTITKKLIRIFATDYVKANIEQFPTGNPFPKEIAGVGWVKNFAKKHPELAKRMTEKWYGNGTGSISLERVQEWFGFVSRYLEKMGLQTDLQKPRQVFTIDDVILKGNRSDVTFTCLFGANACGNMLPPLVLYPEAIKIPTQKKQSELNYAVAHQDTELTAGNAFYQWLSRVFEPWLIEENVPRPVILFVDGHRHQMGYRSSHFCQQHQIVPVAILPRNNHMLRPLNVKLFETIRKLWPDEMKSPDNHIFNSMDPLLKPILDKLTDTKNIIRDGFYQSKLYPWNPDGHTADDSSVIVSKVQKNAAKSEICPEGHTTADEPRPGVVPRPTVDPMMALFRRMLESRLSEQQLADFEAQRHDEVWQGPIEQTGLFQIWRDLMNEIDVSEPELEGDESCLEPEIVLVKQEDTSECSLDAVKEEPKVDFEDL